MENIYQVKAVVVPVVPKEAAALASQIGGLPGISLPGTATASEIVALLKSNILREKMVERYNLMPILFYEKWDREENMEEKRLQSQPHDVCVESPQCPPPSSAQPDKERSRHPGYVGCPTALG